MNTDPRNQAFSAASLLRHNTPAPQTALGIRGLIAYTAIFWGCFSVLTFAYAWDLFGQSANALWRGIVTDMVGAGLCIALALLLTEARRWGAAARLLLALVLCFVAVAIYAAVALILVGSLTPEAPDGATGPTRLVRAVLVNYWVFAAYAGFFLLLDQGNPRALEPAPAAGVQAVPHTNVLTRAQDWGGLEARWFWTFQGVFWTAMAIFSTANLINGGEDVGNSWRVVLAECTGLMASSLAHFWVLKPTRLWPLYRRAALALAVSLLLTIIYISAIWAAYFQIFPVDAPMRDGEPVDTGLSLLLYMGPRWMFLNFPVFVGWSGFYLALDAARRLRVQERQLYRSIMLAQESELKMLRFQLNPHFLFNTLNAISSLLLDNRGREADAMLTRLSGFLRFTLDAAPDDRVPLRREIEAQRHYLEIEKARFTDRLELDIEMEEATADALVPTMILQPLLENAVKYAVARSLKPVHVAVRARCLSPERLELTVTDSGAGSVSMPAASGPGVGLTNIRARLDVLYGEAASFEAGPRPEGGFEATITMPLERDGASERGKMREETDAGTSGR